MRSLREPRDGQRRALAACKGKEAFAFLMAMRTGKTKATLDDFVRLYERGEVSDLLVIAPGGVYETWAGAIPLEIGEPPEVYVWRSGKNGAAEERRRKAFLRNESGRPRALVMNVEALSIKSTGAKAMAERFLLSGAVYMVVDESTAIKNHSAKRTRAVIGLGDHAPYRRILSGLPSPRSPLDVYSQFAFLDWRIIGHRSWYTFRARYAVLRERYIAGRRFKEVVGYQNEEELRRLIAPHSFRLRLEDCYDLPPSTYAMRQVEMTPEQKRHYADMRDFATTQLASMDHVTATIVITQMLKMHQVLCGHVSDEAGVRHAIPENRTRTLLEVLDLCDGKAIVWCSYDHDVRKVAAAIERGTSGKGPPEGRLGVDAEGLSYDRVLRGYGRGSAAIFYGGNRKEREAEERRFKEDPACRFMVATPAAGGKGRTWDVADLVVYYSSTNDLEHRAQSEERPRAVGKTKSIHYVDLVVPGTIDEKIIAALRAKINLAAAITGDDYREWLV